MKTYPAVRDPGSIELLFRNIRSKDQPDKITTDYLASIGFRRQPDVKLLELLFFLGFIDNNLSPTDQWKAIRDINDKDFRDILSPAISEAYQTVFQYQADQKTTDSKLLMTFFKKETGVSDTESAYMVLTLQVLIDLAQLNDTVPETNTVPAVPVLESETEQTASDAKTSLPDVSDEPAPGMTNFANGVSLNITIPADAMDAELIAMIKKLLRKVT
ncbi:MAG: DUF5343 domain-containing protein [Candidatus Fermentibacteria bacterium]|nr:DUF5343 domain-containing protein [Candidatus Fermentibacteria bacterium]